MHLLLYSCTDITSITSFSFCIWCSQKTHFGGESVSFEIGNKLWPDTFQTTNQWRTKHETKTQSQLQWQQKQIYNFFPCVHSAYFAVNAYIWYLESYIHLFDSPYTHKLLLFRSRFRCSLNFSFCLVVCNSKCNSIHNFDMLYFVLVICVCVCVCARVLLSSVVSLLFIFSLYFWFWENGINMANGISNMCTMALQLCPIQLNFRNK